MGKKTDQLTSSSLEGKVNRGIKAITNGVFSGSLFTTPLNELIYYAEAPRFIDLMKANPGRLLTVHLYHVPPYKNHRKKTKKVFPTVLDIERVGYNQLYFVKTNDGKVYWCNGNGDTSLERENHNRLIDAVLNDDALKKEGALPTLILVVNRQKSSLNYLKSATVPVVVAHHVHPSYAYVNFDIGSNTGDRDFPSRVDNSGLPYSTRRGLFPEDKTTVRFQNGNDIKIVYAKRLVK